MKSKIHVYKNYQIGFYIKLFLVKKIREQNSLKNPLFIKKH